MRVLTPTRSSDDEAALRRVLKRERRAWHLSAFVEFAQLRRFTGWFTDAHPVAPRDGEHCVAAACARARWTRSRVVALWAARELDLLTARVQEDPSLPPPGSCWVDQDGEQCAWIGSGLWNYESRRRAEHLRDGGSIDTYPRGKS